MIEVSKKQYDFLLKISELNLNKVYYNVKLANELDVSDNLKVFREIIQILKDNNVLEYGEKIGSVVTYSIDKKELIDLIANTDICQWTNERFAGLLGSQYKFWDYSK